MHQHHDHIAGGHHHHDHDHEHHHHHHDHDHDHHHDHDCGGHCGSCQSQCEHSPMEELAALMKYMVGHNAAHAKELADLAVKLDEAGSHASYHKVMDAVACFDQGNGMLAEVLKELGE